MRASARRKPPDFGIIAAVAGLVGIGIVMIFSASSNRTFVSFGDPYYYLKRQALWVVISVAAMVFAMNFDYWRLRSLARPIFVFSLVLLVIVLIPGLGSGVHGARRWVGIGIARFQPSELEKLALTIFLASLLCERGRARSLRRGIVPVVLIAGLIFGLILLQPDLGTAVACAGTIAVMLFVAGANMWHLAGLGLAAVPVLYLAIFSAEYRRRRFLAFLNPWADPLDTGFHIIQSLYALGSGSLFGLGLGQGRQKFWYLPEQHTDFIFSVLGEELGFLGGAAVIALFALLAWRGFRVAVRAPDGFSCLLAAGLTAMIVLQAAVNIGVVTASIPITGIPLPFISHGGSSLIFTMAGVGILLNISRYQQA
ncbi:MAG: putative lipid II flippase FtsW [Bacillota bacterium]|nr:putative lipid II flippase FtsW [Bacillota bacterium]